MAAGRGAKLIGVLRSIRCSIGSIACFLTMRNRVDMFAVLTIGNVKAEATIFAVKYCIANAVFAAIDMGLSMRECRL